MMSEHRRMSGWRYVLAVMVSVAGCTKPNPRSCADGTCTDPAFPFCDVDGALEGTPKQCIAVSCTPGQVDVCRGDQAVTCNAEGTDYDIVQCDLGCDLNVGGCRQCEPNETACTNGTVATCDASGNVTASEDCPLGCFEDEPRCREIASSNNLDAYLDAARTASDLDLSLGGSIDTSTGEVRNGSNAPVPVSTVLLPVVANGAAIRVLVARRVQLGDVHVVSNGVSGPALAIVAADEITIAGELTLWSDNYEGVTTPGGVSLASCVGEPGTYQRVTSPGQDLWTGGGGGGHATPGGRGGGIDYQAGIPGGAGGAASGSSSLEPLRGGCAGGYGGSGGGAVQLTSRKAIRLSEGATINANGILGVAYRSGPDTLGGGGAGGGILLEAPEVTIGASARLLVNGGPAATESNLSPPSSLTRAASIGATCTSSTGYHCANGGNGAGADAPATNGAAVTYTTAPGVTTFRAAGGGGGLGFIRINTATGAYEKASDAIESGILSTSEVRTR